MIYSERLKQSHNTTWLFGCWGSQSADQPMRQKRDKTTCHKGVQRWTDTPKPQHKQLQCLNWFETALTVMLCTVFGTEITREDSTGLKLSKLRLRLKSTLQSRLHSPWVLMPSGSVACLKALSYWLILTVPKQILLQSRVSLIRPIAPYCTGLCFLGLSTAGRRGLQHHTVTHAQARRQGAWTWSHRFNSSWIVCWNLGRWQHIKICGKIWPSSQLQVGISQNNSTMPGQDEKTEGSAFIYAVFTPILHQSNITFQDYPFKIHFNALLR